MKRVRKQKGITLVALIITIIVLLILAMVAIRAVQGDGIITHVKNAKTDYQEAQDKEAISLALSEWKIVEATTKDANFVGFMQGKFEPDQVQPGSSSDEVIVTLGNGNQYRVKKDGTITKIENVGATTEPVTNPYEEETWLMAWTCTNGVWNDDPITAGNTAEGDIVAKLYAGGKEITPKSYYYNGTEFTFNKGDSYKMVIEGEGNMPPLITMQGENITGANAWQLPSMAYMMGTSGTCIVPYITELTICDGITNIGANAFNGTTGLQSITLGTTIKSIEEYCFSYSDIEQISLPSGLETIGYGAFSGCSNLTNITIPNSVTSIGKYAFSTCGNLTDITIEHGVSDVGECTFAHCSGLTNITIPNSVTSIGTRAFESCNSLTNITIPDSVTSMGDYVFCNCSSLTNVTIPNSVTSIGYSAFWDCSSLTKVTIPNSVTNIGGFAFSNCSSLTNITIPNSVTNMEDFVFNECSSLTKVKILAVGADLEITNNAFVNLAENSTIYVLSEEVKTKLEGKYSESKTTVEVVTLEQMQAL